MVRSKTPALQREFVLYRKRMTRDEVHDEPVSKNDHLMDCLRYLAAYNPQYNKPKTLPGQWSPAYAAYRDWQKVKGSKDEDYVNLGPGRT